MKIFSVLLPIYLLFTCQSMYAGLSGITIDTMSVDSYQIIAQIVVDIQQATEEQFNAEISRFAQNISNKIGQLGEYSDQADKDFDDFCSNELKFAITRVTAISKAVLKKYYDGLVANDLISNIGTVDPIAQDLQRGINSIAFDVINELKSATIILDNGENLALIGNQIASGIASYQSIAEQNYAARQLQASQGRKTSAWKEIKASGKQFLADFSVRLQAESKIAFENTMKDTLNDLGNQAVQQVGSLATSAGKSIAVSLGLDKIGTQAISQLQGYAPDKLTSMFNKLPKYLSSQALHAVGIDPDEDLMAAGLKSVIRQQYPVNQNFDTLQVRQSIDLCTAEQNFLKNRMPKAMEALQQNFGVTQPLKIGLCTSGGGNRAMLVALGFFLGAQDIGLFDTILYTAGVSGSTWTIAPWSYLHATKGMTLDTFKDQVVNGPISQSMVSLGGVSTPAMLNKEQQTIAVGNVAQRFAYDQTISTIDMYGAFVGNFSLMAAGKDRLNVTWSSIAPAIEQGMIPLPMGAAVSYKKDQKTKGLTDYYWYEVGPFEVGSEQIQGYVPTWAFGSKFKQGRPVDSYQGKAPEYPISFYEGVFGSAFAASINEVVDQKLTNPSFALLGHKVELPVDRWIKDNLSQDVRDTRLYPASFHNFTAGLSTSPIASADQIRLYDGAMSINYPVPLLLRQARDLDVILICDAKVDLLSLRSTKVYCQRNNIKFPDISKYTKKILGSKPVTILNDPRSADYDPTMKVFVYCPFIKNNGYSATFDPEICMAEAECQTFNFKYKPDQAARVIDLARYNINQIKDEITAVLQTLEKRKIAKA